MNDAAPQVLARLGPLVMALPAAAVDRALHGSTPCVPLPRHQGPMVEVMDLDGELLPVLDLARWVRLPDMPDTPDMAPAAQDEGAPALLVLRDGGRALALRVDTLLGLAQLQAGSLRRLHHQDHPQEVFDTVARTHRTEAPTVCLLNLPRLLDLMQIWSAGAATAAADTTHAALSGPSSEAARPLVARIRVGAWQLCVAVPLLDELLPLPTLSSRWAHGGASLGVAVWRQQPVAVLDLERLLGTPRQGDAAPLALVVSEGRRRLMLPIDEFLDLMPLPAQMEAAEDSPWLQGRWLHHGQAVHWMDTSALLAQRPEATLGERPQAAMAGEMAGDMRRNASPFIVYEAQQRQAMAIDRVQAVLPAGSLQGGLARWRQQDIPAQGADLGGPVLIIGEQAPWRALPIRQLIALVPAHSAELLQLGQGQPPTQMLSVPSLGASYCVVTD